SRQLVLAPSPLRPRSFTACTRAGTSPPPLGLLSPRPASPLDAVDKPPADPTGRAPNAHVEQPVASAGEPPDCSNVMLEGALSRARRRALEYCVSFGLMDRPTTRPRS